MDQPPVCPIQSCGSAGVTFRGFGTETRCTCDECGHQWTTTLPDLRWIRRVERQLAPPGWVQIQALPALTTKTDLAAAQVLSPGYLYVFTNAAGTPAITREPEIGEGWDYEGVIVQASAARARGVITDAELERASKEWT